MKRTVLWAVLAGSLGLNAGFLISAWSARRAESPPAFELPESTPSLLAEAEEEPVVAEPTAHELPQDDRTLTIGTRESAASPSAPPSAESEAAESSGAGSTVPAVATEAETPLAVERPRTESSRELGVEAQSPSRTTVAPPQAPAAASPGIDASTGSEPPAKAARARRFPLQDSGDLGEDPQGGTAPWRDRLGARPGSAPPVRRPAEPFEQQVRNAVRELVEQLRLREEQRPEFVRYQVEMVRTLRRSLQAVDPLRRQLRFEMSSDDPDGERLDQLLQRVARIELQAERRLVELRVRSRRLLDERQNRVYDVFLERRLTPLRDRLRGATRAPGPWRDRRPVNGAAPERPEP